MKAKYYLGLMLLASLSTGFTACNEDDDFSIETQPIIQSVVTSNADVSAVTATCYGTVNSLDGQASNSYSVGAYYVKGDADPKTGTRVVGSYSDGMITASITGLETGVTYSYCSYVTLQGRQTYYGDTQQFTTFSAKVVTEEAGSISGAKATLGGTVSETGNVSGLTCGFKLSTDAEQVKVGYDVNYGELPSSSFQYQMAGLLPSTTYYYAAYANLGTGFVYGETKSFTTGDVQFEYVDLGLSAQWATFNVGAESVAEVGALAGYGDVTGLLTADDASCFASGNIYGGKHDIATAVHAGRLPTLDEVKELVNQCTYEWTSVDGVEGARFTAPNGNSVFFPLAAGYWTGSGSSSSGVFSNAYEVNAQSANLTAEQVVKRLAVRPVMKGSTSLDAALINNTWYIDLDQYGNCCVFDGPLYYYGTDDNWASVTDGDIIAGDSWNWCPVWSDNTWLQAAADFGTMTFSEDGKVVVNDLGNNVSYEGTYTVDVVNKTLSLEGAKILHLSNFDAIVTNWSSNLKIMSLTDKSMQIAALRDNSSEGECLLVHNYVTEAAQLPVWQGVPAALQFATGDWAASRWDTETSKTCTDVTGFGQYTVKGTVGAGSGLNVFCIDLLGYKTFFGEAVFNNTVVTLNEIQVDGQPIEINAANIVCGDLEDKGNLRIEIYNTWGYTPEGAEQPLTVTNPVIADAANFKVENDVAVTFTLSALAPEASLSVSDPNWSPSAWGAAGKEGNAIIDGMGTYTVTADCGGAINGVNVFVIDIYNYLKVYGQEVFDNTEPIINKITIDGKEVACNSSKLQYGDIEGNGNYRIEIYNDYGYKPEGADQPLTVSDPAIDKNEMVGQNVEVNFTLREKVKGYTVNFATCDTNWNWLDHRTTIQPVEGQSYTFEAAGAQTNGMIDIIDFEGLCADYPNAIIRVDEVKVDGSSISFDANRLGYGDIEGKGNFRIELFNCYGPTHEQGTDAFGGTDPASAAALACAEKIEVTVTIVTLSGYTAGLTTCDSNWNSAWPDASIALPLGGCFPREYTVTVEGSRANGMIDLVEIQNVMASFPNIQLTLTKVVVDGAEVSFDASKIVYGDLEGKGHYRIELYNTYGASKGNAAFEGETSDGVIPALGFTQTMAVTFTLDKLY